MMSLGRKVYRLIKKSYSSYSLPCFYCSADSTELKIFLILTIGGLALCSVFTCIGVWAKGGFKNTEELNDYPLKVEGKGRNYEK